MTLRVLLHPMTIRVNEKNAIDFGNLMDIKIFLFSGVDYQINSFGKSEYEIDYDYWASEENVTYYSGGEICLNQKS